MCRIDIEKKKKGVAASEESDGRCALSYLISVLVLLECYLFSLQQLKPLDFSSNQVFFSNINSCPTKTCELLFFLLIRIRQRFVKKGTGVLFYSDSVSWTMEEGLGIQVRKPLFLCLKFY